MWLAKHLKKQAGAATLPQTRSGRNDRDDGTRGFFRQRHGMVQPATQSGCGGCSSRSVCGVSGLGKYFSGNRKAIQVQCDANVHAGDELQLSMSEGDMLKSGLLAYLLPSVLALVGASIGAS